jgi:antitoxin component of RelBE/YafQ-DinJ toxin-antitoxin module
MEYETIEFTMDKQDYDNVMDLCDKLGITLDDLVNEFLLYTLRNEMLLRIVAEAQAKARGENAALENDGTEDAQ